MEKKIILIPSQKMDNNRKEDRNEQILLRMPKTVREHLDANGEGLEISGDGVNSINFGTFKAFAEDLKTATTILPEGALERVCFVTTKNFKALGGKDQPFIEVAKFEEAALNLLIGTDPELLIMQNGKVINAGNVLTNNKQAKFGADGAMAELRPDPSLTPDGLVKNIKKILAAHKDMEGISKLDWVSACYVDSADRDYPVGTHIHIDNPKKVANLDKETRLRLFAVTNKIMDELLTIPMVRLDGPTGHSRRAHCKMSTHNGFNHQQYGKGYGFFGEWREANGRLEHRSLSGLVLARPDLCGAVFGTAKAIAEAVYAEAIKNKLNPAFILPAKFDAKAIYSDNFTAWADIPLAETFGCVTNSKAVADTMNKSCRIEVSPNYIKKWLKRMRTLPTYKKFAEEIEALGDMLSCSANTLDSIDKNIKTNWKE